MNNYYEVKKAQKYQKHLQMDQNYNQYTRQYIVDNQHLLPTTSPPSYPGVSNSSNRNSGLFSSPDMSSSTNLQVQSMRDFDSGCGMDRQVLCFVFPPAMLNILSFVGKRD